MTNFASRHLEKREKRTLRNDSPLKPRGQRKQHPRSRVKSLTSSLPTAFSFSPDFCKSWGTRRTREKMQRGKCQSESSEEIRQKVDLLALAARRAAEARAPSSGEVAGISEQPAWLASTRQPGKEQKAPAAPVPAWGTHCPPSGYGEKSPFFFFFSPSPSQSQGKGGAPREPAPGEAPGAHLQPRRRGPAGDVPRRPEPGSSRRAYPSLGRLGWLPARATSARDCGNPRGPARHLPFQLFPHGCKGCAVGGGRAEE